MSAEVGQSAPELTLINNERQPVTLADIKGKTTLIFLSLLNTLNKINALNPKIFTLY